MSDSDPRVCRPSIDSDSYTSLQIIDTVFAFEDEAECYLVELYMGKSGVVFKSI